VVGSVTLEPEEQARDFDGQRVPIDTVDTRGDNRNATQVTRLSPSLHVVIGSRQSSLHTGEEAWSNDRYGCDAARSGVSSVRTGRRWWVVVAAAVSYCRLEQSVGESMSCLEEKCSSSHCGI
jgi:hypothetical protein